MSTENLKLIMRGHGLMAAENYFSRNQKKEHIYYWNVPVDNLTEKDKSKYLYKPIGNTCLVWLNDQRKVEEITFERIAE